MSKEVKTTKKVVKTAVKVERKPAKVIKAEPKVTKKVTAVKPKELSTAWLVVSTIIVIIAVAIFTSGTKEAKAEFKNITTNDFINLYNSSERSIVLIGRPTCSYCVKFTPVLQKVAAKYDLVINYWNMDENVKNEDDFNRFTAVDPFLKGEWGTPLLIITDNKKLDANKLEGYREEKDLIEYLKQTKMIK